MELYHHQNSLLSIIYEERSHNSLETLNHDQTLYEDKEELQEYPYYPSPSPAHGPGLPPGSPESPWTCSPLQTPSPSLLYHCIASLRRHDGTIHSLAASPGGLVFAASESRRVRAWRAPDFADRALLKARSGGVRAILAHAGTLFTSHRDNKVRIWSYDEGAAGALGLSFRRLSSVPRRSRSRLSSILPWPNGRARGCSRTAAVTCMAYHHAEGILYTGSTDRTVSAWRVSDGRRVDSFAAHEGGVTSMAVSQDDGCLFTGSHDGSVRIWRRIYRENSHTLTMILRFQDSAVNAVALSPAAAFLYTGSADGTVSFWERERERGGGSNGRFGHGGFLQGHRFAVLCVAAVEKMVFSGSEDTTVRIWRREEGSCVHECLAVIDVHRGPVRCLSATLEVAGHGVFMLGFLLYTASLDQTLKVWRVKVLPEELDHDGVVLETSASRSVASASPVLSPSWVERKRQATYFS